MKKFLYVIILMIVVLSCKEENVFQLSPSKRTDKYIEELKNELIKAPNGWMLTYFPKSDSLLYSNLDELITGFDLQNNFGYGGHCFSMKFYENGSVETTSDFDENSLKNTITSEYLIGQNSSTQLSFTTYSYIHKIVNDKFGGKQDFLYMGKDRKGNLLFRTTSYIEPAREFVCLSMLKESDDPAIEMRKYYDNTIFFMSMKKPCLTIRKGDKILFRSDMKKSYYRGDMKYRYHLFLYAKELALVPGDAPKKMTGLGSGYSGTAEGIFFYPGIRFSSKYIFNDFVKDGNRFKCELVENYNPFTGTKYITSRHLEPNGIPLGILAEIYDDNNIEL